MVGSSSTSNTRCGGRLAQAAAASSSALRLPTSQANGRRTVKAVPSPNALSTSMEPPIAIASSWQIASPRPLPP